MIFITGDCHADFWKLGVGIFPEQKDLTKNDYMIICGDFGGVWARDTSKFRQQEEVWLDWLEKRPYTVLFIDGNHENFDRLYKYPVKEWKGGKVHEIRPSVLHLMRGEIFEICDKKIFTFGGASSHDIDDGILYMDEDEQWRKTARQFDLENKMYRICGLSWWEQELPTEAEMQNGFDNLEKHKNKVDYIISHTPPASIIAEMGQGLYAQDYLTNYLEEIKQDVEYKKWFFGHMHINANFKEHKSIGIYEQIIRIA